MRFGLTAGQRHDASQALPLLNGMALAFLIASWGYDFAPLTARGIQAMIPHRRERRHPRAYNVARYA